MHRRLQSRPDLRFFCAACDCDIACEDRALQQTTCQWVHPRQLARASPAAHHCCRQSTRDSEERARLGRYCRPLATWLRFGPTGDKTCCTLASVLRALECTAPDPVIRGHSVHTRWLSWELHPIWVATPALSCPALPRFLGSHIFHRSSVGSGLPLPAASPARCVLPVRPDC